MAKVLTAVEKIDLRLQNIGEDVKEIRNSTSSTQEGMKHLATKSTVVAATVSGIGIAAAIFSIILALVNQS